MLLALRSLFEAQPSTQTLAADAGSFTLNGQGVVFSTQQVSALGTYALTGQSLTFQFQWPESVGNYALAGQDATFIGQLSVSAGSYALNGQGIAFAGAGPADNGAFAVAGSDAILQVQLAVSFGSFALAGQAIGDPAPALVAETGLYVLSGGSVVDIAAPVGDTVGGGAGIIHRATGANFSRRRWLALLAEIEAERKAALVTVKARKPRARKAIRASAIVAQQAIEVARETFEPKVRVPDLRAMTAALEAAARAKSVAIAYEKAKQATELAQAILAAYQAEIDDEEEAITLLLAA